MLSTFPNTDESGTRRDGREHESIWVSLVATLFTLYNTELHFHRMRNE